MLGQGVAADRTDRIAEHLNAVCLVVLGRVTKGVERLLKIVGQQRRVDKVLGFPFIMNFTCLSQRVAPQMRHDQYTARFCASATGAASATDNAHAAANPPRFDLIAYTSPQPLLSLQEL